MTAVLALHQQLANAVVLYFAALGLWGLFLAITKRPFDSAYRGALVIGGLLGVAQAVIGLTLVVSGLRPRDDLHYLYGLSVIVALPLVHQYISTRRFSRVLAYGLASLFIMGLGIRAITTGG
jgi:heme A synthase